MSPSSQEKEQHQQPHLSTTFGGPDADLTNRLLQSTQAPTSPTNTTHAEEARRRTSEWKPTMPGRAPSFSHEEHKHAMMSASGTLSAAGSGGADGFTERA